MFSIDSRSRVAIYEQLVQNIIGLIARGVLQPDDQLPSVRNLARDLGINPNTVQKAYQELESEGIIYTVGGKGCFVGGRENAAAAIRQKAMDELAEALRQGRLAGLDRTMALELLEQCYGGGEP